MKCQQWKWCPTVKTPCCNNEVCLRSLLKSASYCDDHNQWQVVCVECESNAIIPNKIMKAYNSRLDEPEFQKKQKN